MAIVPDRPGGTGETFDWSLIPPRLDRPVILSGGLTPENVGAGDARACSPWAVDVSSGVEAGEGRQGRREDRRIHRRSVAMQMYDLARRRAAISARTAASSSPRR